MPRMHSAIQQQSFTKSSSAQPSNEICFESVFNASAIGIGICNADGCIVKTNPALDRMLGYNHDELFGMCFRQFNHRDDDGEDDQLLQQLLAGELPSYQLERRYVRKDGNVFWGRHTASLMRAADGRLIAIIGMIEDISDFKSAQEQLIEAQKLEAIGRLVGGVAHDFNNLLTGIMLYCDLLIDGTDQDRLRRHACEIRMAGEHGAALVQQLLTIARKHIVEPTILSLNEVVSSMMNLLSRLIGEQIELALDLESDLWPVRLDPTQAQQIVLNLVLNARDAILKSGRVIVTTRNCNSGVRAKGQSRPIVSLSVSDTGSGMNPETQARLFEPFFTTKEPGKGNGLGLATVYRIVRDAGGTILVESEVGKGTRIDVVLPGVDDAAVRGQAGSIPADKALSMPLPPGAGPVTEQGQDQFIGEGQCETDQGR